MDRIDELVDQVIAAFAARRRTRWSLTTAALTDTGLELEQWKQRVEARIKAFRHSGVDRAALQGLARKRFAGAEWTANFAAIADELQELSRADLKRYLTDNGMPESAAQKVAASYSIGALLHR